MKIIHNVWRVSTKSVGIGLLTCASLLGSQGISWGAFAGDSEGIFVQPTGPGAGVPGSFVGQGTDFFQWGIAVQPGGAKSSLRYADEPLGFSTGLNTPFKIGTLTYFNGTSELNTGADSVKLDLKINFTLPNGISSSFLYTMTIQNTPNDSNPGGPADSITLSSFPDKTFTHGGTTYLLSLGFKDFSGGTFENNRWYLSEMSDETANLNGKITVVPEPSSILAGGLLMLPFAGWMFRAARQRVQRS